MIRFIAKLFFVLFFAFLLITNKLNTNVFASEISKDKAIFMNGTNENTLEILNINNKNYIYAYDFSKILNGSFTFNQTDYNFLTSKMLVDENELTFKLDSNVFNYNGKNLSITEPMRIVDNRIVIPVSALKSTLGIYEFTHIKNNTKMLFYPRNNTIYYKVMSGDSLWIISQTFNTLIDDIKKLNSLTNNNIYVGQILAVKQIKFLPPNVNATTKWWVSVRSLPDTTSAIITSIPQNNVVSVIGKIGDYYKIQTSKGPGYVSVWALQIIQNIDDTSTPSKYFTNYIPVDTSSDSVTYTSYKVQSGDDIWKISVKYGIPDNELMQVNNLTASSIIYVGQLLKIPVHSIALKPANNGLELLDWFKQGNYLFPIGSVGKFTDIATGKSFYAKRTMGATHADVETLTYTDTQIMKEIFGGYWTWTRRPFILEINGRKIAVSISGMPHAGVDGAPYNSYVSNRSGDYGYGPNLDTIKNGMDGHFDVYTLNGLRHKDNLIDPLHQLTVSIAAGLR